MRCGRLVDLNRNSCDLDRFRAPDARGSFLPRTLPKFAHHLGRGGLPAAIRRAGPHTCPIAIRRARGTGFPARGNQKRDPYSAMKSTQMTRRQRRVPQRPWPSHVEQIRLHRSPSDSSHLTAGRPCLWRSADRWRKGILLSLSNADAQVVGRHYGGQIRSVLITDNRNVMQPAGGAA